MKRTISMTADEAEKWLRENPGKTIKDRDGYEYDGRLLDAPACFSLLAPYTREEEVPEETEGEAARVGFKKMFWRNSPIFTNPDLDENEITTTALLVKERNQLRSKVADLEKRNRDLYAEWQKAEKARDREYLYHIGREYKGKSWAWKNCAETPIPFHSRGGLLALQKKGRRWGGAFGFVTDRGAKWYIHASLEFVPLPDPENWEYLELEE